MAMHPRTHDAYTVGWVCALPKEQTAAIVMLEERHSKFSKLFKNPNSYTLGLICGHNIVITCLLKGKIGISSAAIVAIHMVGAFSAVRFGLMVGIGGGVPPKVRLGDVVVSVFVDYFSGVVQ
jgi:nucleoside phosphorylase